MQLRGLLGLAAMLSVACSVGCSMTNSTVRGQNPDYPVPNGYGGPTAPMPGYAGPVSQMPGYGGPNAPPIYPGSNYYPGPYIGAAPGYGDLKRAPYLGHTGRKDFTALGLRDNNFGYEGGYYAGPQGYYTDRDRNYGAGNFGNCDDCNNGQACPRGGCRRCGRGFAHHNGLPHHIQSYQYNWPTNQVYPAEGVPAGMVQYPYYTLRGPTDFFMQ